MHAFYILLIFLKIKKVYMVVDNETTTSVRKESSNNASYVCQIVYTQLWLLATVIPKI